MSPKDPVAVSELKAGASKPSRRDAVGAEIPVTVHASRTTQGLGKNLPSVHEDTKTVIVLQQGAVVRLTASLTTGETVVLTNRMTGTDVLCRVGNVKSQPGIQQYVDLEFIQRAPGFWGDAIAAASAPVASQTPLAVPVPPAAPARLAAPIALLPLPPVPASAPPPAPVTVAAPPPAPVAAAAPPPPAPVPVTHLRPAVAAETIEPTSLAEPLSTSWNASQASPVAPMGRGLDDSSFGSIRAESVAVRASGSSKALLAVAAVVLLVLGAAAGGFWFYSRQTAASSPALQPAASLPPVAVPSDFDFTAESSPVIDPAPPALDTAVPQPQADVVVQSPPSMEASADRVPPPPVAAARTPAPRRNTVPIGQIKAPKARTTTTRIGSSEPPPVVLGAVSLGDTAAANSLLVAEPAGPAPPPAVGGQLLPPQMIKSTPPVYPQDARMHSVQGVVVVDALVDETGKVVETTVISGPQPLRLAAQESVRNWKYKPAQLNGKPIAVHTTVSLRFNLR
jgi:periplasmic protein TonB